MLALCVSVRPGPATLEREEHAADLLALVRDECRGCKDVPRLLAAASCLSNLAGASGPVRRGALTALLNMVRGSRLMWSPTALWT